MLAGKIEEHRMGELITKDDLLKIENRIFDKIGLIVKPIQTQQNKIKANQHQKLLKQKFNQNSPCKKKTKGSKNSMTPLKAKRYTTRWKQNT